MTVLLGVTSLALSVALLFFQGDIASVVNDRTRAQLAADAAALAAIAENVPGRGGSPEHQARRFAQANGGTVVTCGCERGRTAVEVAVRVGRAVARARAVFDPSRLMPLAGPSSTQGLHPRLEAAVARLIGAAGGEVHLVSGWRSVAHQEALWRAALQRYGSPEAADDWVARPGTSAHEMGSAVDLGGDLERAVALIDALDLPLYRPLPHEPWHFELLGSSG